MLDTVMNLFKKKPVVRCSCNCDAHRILKKLYDTSCEGYGDSINNYSDVVQNGATPKYTNFVWVASKQIKDDAVIEVFTDAYKYLHD